MSRSRRARALVALSVLSVVLALWSRPADACVAPTFPIVKKGPPDEKLPVMGDLRVVVAQDKKATFVTIDPGMDADARAFAFIVPVPVAVKKTDLAVVDGALLDELDRWAAPLVTHVVDPDPCAVPSPSAGAVPQPDAAAESSDARPKKSAPRASQYGIEVETHAYVGVYETAVLQAKDGKDLARWLKKFHYRVTPEVEALMVDYVAKKWRFFVARVDGKKLAKGAAVRLTPLRLRLATEKIVLPIRMAGAGNDTPRDIVVTVVGAKGVATSATHELVPLPTSVEIPTSARGVAAPLHKSIVARALDKAGERPVAVVERSGRLSLDAAALKKLGASDKSPFATRVHTLVDRRAAHDLALAVGDDRAELVVTYVEWTPWQPASGAELCAEGERYLDTVGPRVDTALLRLQELAGTDRDAHVARAFPNGLVRAAPKPPPPPEAAPPKAKPKKSAIETWQIVAGLGVFVVLLIVYGRIRRAS